MNKHTPGPWTYHHEPSLNRYAVRAEPFGTETILSISYWSRTPIWDRERAEADASRIVSCVNACDGINPEAVPDLLAACEAALSFGEGHPDRTPSWHDARLATQLTLRAAIAKAEGRGE